MSRTVVITGGSSGIGLACAKKFAAQGFTVYELSRRGGDDAAIRHIACDVTDEAAVAEAIKAGRLGGFASDVYSTEPFGEDHPFSSLLGLDNVLLTPHMAWGAIEARVRCLGEIVKNIDAFLGGEKRCRVD